MNAKTSVIIICGEAIIYLSFYNLHDCTFKKWCEFIPLFAFIRKCRNRIKKSDLTLVSLGSSHGNCEELSNIE